MAGPLAFQAYGGHRFQRNHGSRRRSSTSPTEQHVCEAAAQPRLTGAIVVPTVDRFLEDMGVVTAKPADFLTQPMLRAGHQVLIAAIPQVAAACEAPGHTHAVRLDDVLGEWFGIQRWELTMPVDNLATAGGIGRRRFVGRSGSDCCGRAFVQHGVCPDADPKVHEVFRRRCCCDARVGTGSGATSRRPIPHGREVFRVRVAHDAAGTLGCWRRQQNVRELQRTDGCRRRALRQGLCSCSHAERLGVTSNSVRRAAEVIAGEGSAMKVRDIMTCPPQTCHSSTSLSAASRHMHDSNCGTLVAMDPAGQAGGDSHRSRPGRGDLHMAGDPSRIPVDTVMTRRVHTCRPDDDLHAAIAEMARWRVRRLPVVDRDGDVTGMISVDDIVLWGIHHRGLGLHSATRALRVIVASSEVVIEPPSL